MIEMTELPLYQQAWMQTIESTVKRFREEFPKLVDTEVEYAYKQLKLYYDGLAKGKNMTEPTSTIERRQALIDELLNTIETREEMQADEYIVNNEEYKPAGRPIPSLASFYVICLNRLYKSVRFWTKEHGKTGYLNFICYFVL